MKTYSISSIQIVYLENYIVYPSALEFLFAKGGKMKVSKFSAIFIILASFILSATLCIASEEKEKNTASQEQREYSEHIKEWKKDYDREQVERQKAVEEYGKQLEGYGKLLERGEKQQDKTEEQQKRFDQILSVWEKQQKQYQEYLNSLKKN